MHSFRGTTPPPEILAGVRRGAIAAFCLFNFNFETLAQFRRFNEQLYTAAAEGSLPPPIIGIDQEGGQLIPIRDGATILPGNMALGATNSPELARQAGRVLARELLAVGCNLNFAPVLDLNNNPDNFAVGIRAFGDRPADVARMGVALIAGMQEAGVIATAKHFPGHGDTSTDSHFGLPVVSKSLAELEASDLFPFAEAIRSGVGAVLTGHLLFPALDAENVATVSPAILKGLLRQRMGFGGLIITDAMDMSAVNRLGARASVRAALRAGNDLVLMGHLSDQLALTVEMSGEENAESVARIQRVRRQIPTTLPDLGVIGSAEHQAVAQAIADASITVVRDGGRLPLRPSEETEIAVMTVRPVNITPADTSNGERVLLAEAIRQRHRRTTAIEIDYAAPESAISDAIHAAENADIVIVGTLVADQDGSQAALVRELHRLGKQPIVIALRTPYDLRAFPEIENYLCAYSYRPVSTEAAARVLFGEIEARGILPCTIPGSSVVQV
ncbi:MAG TPA: glycoside hydrolase family 3 N-terminal domain-containing protein [Phototrophicaceae bacterium]|nr:glycoside hydrolase family 3 N-terminal domain-containing protein [Phototrophicaceae bacterium]